MANTFSKCFYHLVYSTKGRRDLIDQQIESRIWAYIGGIARKHGMIAVQIGGIENHVHVLILARAPMSPSKIAQLLKGESSKWIHETFENQRGFAWQDGFGVFTVDPENVPRIVKYIQKQREHHQRQTFEEEFVEMLELHGIEYDERYLFD